MTTLTDLEINLSIAKIEGIVIEHITNTDGSIMVNSEDVEQEYKLYNPLTDDGLCFALMVKYKVDIEHFKCGTVSAYIEDKNHGEVIDTNPNKAILLAIIEANKES